MPTLTAHVAHAQDWLRRHPDTDEAAFIRGTVFPDIRYLGVIKRALSHTSGLTLADVAAAPTAWEAGRRFHCWLDDAWATQVATPELQPGDSARRLTWIAVKLVYEEPLEAAVYDRASLAAMLLGATDEVPLVEWQVKAAEVQHWQKLVAELLAGTPGIKTQVEFFKALKFDDVVISRIEELAAEIRATPAWTQRLEQVRWWVTSEIERA